MPDQQTNSNPIMDQIGEAISLSRSGERDAARERFGAIWEAIGPDEDPFHRCALAHYAADVQPTAEDELVWDLRALPATNEVTDERAQHHHHHSLAVAEFYPSRHLNLARDYQKLGELPQAREHLATAQSRHAALPTTNTATRSGQASTS